MSAKLRLLNNITKGPAIDLYIDGKEVLSGLNYTELSNFINVSEGRHHVAVTAHRTISPLYSLDAYLAANAEYNGIAAGAIGSVGLVILKNRKECPELGNAHVRFVNAAYGSGPVSLLVDGPTLLFENVSYGEVSHPQHLSMKAGTYRWAISPAGSVEILGEPKNIKLDDRHTYTLVSTGLFGDKDYPLRIAVLKDSEDGCTTTPVTSSATRKPILGIF